MSKSKDITPYNDKGQRHGYCECYWFNDKLWYKCNYVNGELNGYCEDYYNFDGEISQKKFYII